MSRKRFVCLSVAGLATALLAAGCGGSPAVTGPEASGPAGSAVLHGAISGAGLTSSSTGADVHALSGGSGWTVSVVGTSLTAEVDDEGRFNLSGVPSGTISLRIEGPGVSAQLSVSGLLGGQVTTIEVRITGGTAQLASPPACSPTAETFFSGTIDSMASTRLVVAGRNVDASRVAKVWRGERRIQLSDLQAGEKVKVWGTLQGDGTVLAGEIAALTTGIGGDVWVHFTGRVESVTAASPDLHANPNTPSPGGFPLLVVKGIVVKTSAETKVWHSGGSAMSASEIKVGQSATVEGWKKSDGSVRATQIVID